MPVLAERFDDFLLGSPFAIVLNTEGLYFLLHDSEFKEIVSNSDLIFIDGVGLQMILNFCGYSHAERLHGPDLFHKMIHSYDGRRRMILGGTENAHEMLIHKYPMLNSSNERFLCSDYIDSNNMDPIFEMINNFSPDEIYVCLGIRKQELIGKLLRQRFPHISIVGLGASIDFESGNIKRTSSLMQKFGLEWFFRMLKEPRMIPRNLRGISALMYFFAAYILKKNNPFNEFNIK